MFTAAYTSEENCVSDGIRLQNNRYRCLWDIAVLQTVDDFSEEHLGALENSSQLKV